MKSCSQSPRRRPHYSRHNGRNRKPYNTMLIFGSTIEMMLTEMFVQDSETADEYLWQLHALRPELRQFLTFGNSTHCGPSFVNSARNFLSSFFFVHSTVSVTLCAPAPTGKSSETGAEQTLLGFLSSWSTRRTAARTSCCCCVHDCPDFFAPSPTPTQKR